jgi:hypothetical protein
VLDWHFYVPRIDFALDRDPHSLESFGSDKGDAAFLVMKKATPLLPSANNAESRNEPVSQQQLLFEISSWMPPFSLSSFSLFAG